LHWFCPRVILVLRTVRRRGPDGPRLACFSKKLLLSGIIYGIPDSRFSIVIDEPLTPVKHIIWSKLVSPIVCVGRFNHQNYLGTRCKPNSLSTPRYPTTMSQAQSPRGYSDGLRRINNVTHLAALMISFPLSEEPKFICLGSVTGTCAMTNFSISVHHKYHQ
jgi:hypothetical protein